MAAFTILHIDDAELNGNWSLLRRSLRDLRREGFRSVTVLDSPDAIDAATIERVRLWSNRRDEVTRPFTSPAPL